MNLSYLQKLLAADRFAVIRTSLRRWWQKMLGKKAKEKQRKLSRDRHLTCTQREDISTGLQDSVTGPVSMTATPSDREAVSYEGEIANVLEETGFEVEIDNTEKKASDQEMPAGVKMTIKDNTVRPRHAFGIVHAFRHAGVAIATTINRKRQKNDTLYITVGPKGGLSPGPPPIQTTVPSQSEVLTTLLEE